MSQRIGLFSCLLLGLLASASSAGPRHIDTLEDVVSARVGVMTGSTGEMLAQARFPSANIQSFDDIMDAVAAVNAGHLDAIVTTFPTAYQVVKNNPGLRVLPEKLDQEDTSVAVRKGNPELLAGVNRIIGELRADGTLEGMRTRWIKQDNTPYEEPDIILPTTGTPLRIGVSATREPFSFVERGRVTGHDGELARRLAAGLGRPLEFVDMKFMALIPALLSDRIDLIVTGMTATPERAKAVDFSQSYFSNAQVLLVRGARSPSAGFSGVTPQADMFASTVDLHDKRIAVLLGSVYDTLARKTFPQATVLQFDTSADQQLAVLADKVDAGLGDEEGLIGVLAKHPQLAMFGEPLLKLPMGVGFRKGNVELRESFNRFLAGIRRDGVYDDMVARWITRQETQIPRIVSTNPNGSLVAGVTAGGLPFAAIQDGELVGFDIEMLKRFAAYLDKDLQFAQMPFGGLIAANASGKVDLIAASIFITEERKQRIDFSDPYYETAGRAYALASRIAATASSPAASAVERSFFDKVKDGFEANILREQRYLLLWDGAKATVLISVLSTVFGTALGALVCFMRMSPSAVLRVPAHGYIAVLRGIPVVVLLMLVFYVVFGSVNIDPVLVAVIAFGMNFAAYVSEMFRSGIEGIDPGQSEAGAAMGFTPTQTFLYIVLPQMLQRVLPVYKGEFISLVKMTSVVGYIAVQDLTKASDTIRSRTFDAFFPLVVVAILYFLIAWVLLQALEYLERRTNPRLHKGARVTAA